MFTYDYLDAHEQVILLTENMMMPLMVPYLYPSNVQLSTGDFKKNDLKEWLLINAKGHRARHSITEYHDV
jgi:hypothetical protein